VHLGFKGTAAFSFSAFILGAALLLVAFAFPCAARAAIQHETIQGKWKGFYICGQGATGLLLTIAGDASSKLTARFYFFAFPENPNVPSGEFELTGSFDSALGRLKLSPSKWIKQPLGYNMVGLNGSLQADQTLQGTIDAPGCGAFGLYKVNEAVEGIDLAAALTGALHGALVVAVPLSFFFSLLLLWLYLRAVKKRMAPHAIKAHSSRFAINLRSGDAPPSQLEVVTIEDSAKPNAAAAELNNQWRFGPWNAAAVYSAAGVGCAAVLGAAFISASGSNFSVLKLVVFTVYCGWPIVLTLSLVAPITRQGWLLAAAVYLIILSALVAIELSISEKFTMTQAIQLWILTNLPGTLIALASLTRRVRAVGPMVMGFTLVVVAGWTVSYALIGTGTLFRRLMLFGLSIGLKGLAPYYAIGVVGVLVLSLGGWMLLRALGVLYRRHWISDQAIIIDSIWFAFFITTGMLLAAGGLWWFAATLAAFAIYKLIVLLGFALSHRKFASRAFDPKLLLLRVFSLGRRSERLFDTFSKSWGYVGSIRLIAGPDLATTTVQPPDFLDFLSGNLGRRFISGPEALSRRLAETEPRRDFDGRYRVAEFLCGDDTWKMALQRLARDSDAVLMDLRSFSRRNNGCIFEIHELLNVMPLDRVVFVIDATTEEVFLRETLANGWARLAVNSPNRKLEKPRILFFQLVERSPANVQRLVRAVAAAAGAFDRTLEFQF
jgi:hypothetical protein